MHLSRDLIASFARDLHISGLPAAEQEKIMAGLGENILMRFGVEVAKSLPEQSKQAWKNLVLEGSTSAITAFLSKEVPATHEIMKRSVLLTVEEFRKMRGKN